ncbi:hypothetical protein CAPTEDRAFT_202569 [Capitella teleta]|uniref:Major facilitator superfamily (MFS) profile domain-containing protein n=1 Tax=Capitella teleta TaxID=283909 RepID=R7V9X0_CAPTE|nr:hypothetical protein CAPTEDRAFT_202569 [Capitella teleta]|eukprot:ELU13131.1 hypothetical protein CAPTEDRAFT_202569 [Capitella teleta]
MVTTTEEAKEREGIQEDPRDRGWAWVIAVAVGLLNVLLQGTLKILGLVYLEWLVLYQESPTATSWVGSLFTLAIAVLAPFVGNANDHFSAKTARIMVFVCGIILCVCFFAAGWMERLLVVLLIFGLAGVVVAVASALILSLLSRYFLHKLSTANGIAFSCSSLGGLVLPLGLTRANEEYGVRGTLMIFGGLWLNLLVISATMIPLPRLAMSSTKVQHTSLKATDKPQKPSELLDGKLPQNKQPSELLNIKAPRDKQPSELLDGKTPQVMLLSIRNLGEADPYSSQSLSNDKLNNHPAKYVSQVQVSCIEPGEMVKKCASTETNTNDGLTPVKSNTPQSSSTQGITKRHKNNTPEQLANDVKLSMNVNQAQQSAMTTPKEHTEQGLSNVCVNGIRNYLKFIRTPQLPSFLIASFFGSFAYYNQFFVIPPLAVEIGMSKIMASNIIAIISVTELLGRFGIGFLADRLGEKRVLIPLVSTICCFVCGLLLALNISEKSFLGFAPFLGMFGGIFTPLFIPVAMDLVPPDRMGSTAGLFPLITGGSVTIGMPILSAVYEKTSSYKTGYLICVCSNAVAAILLFIHVAARCHKCKKNTLIEPVL